MNRYLILCCSLLFCVALGTGRHNSSGNSLRLAVSSPLDGTWKLDLKRDAPGCVESLLALVGVEYFKRQVVATLDMTDRYVVSFAQFRVTRSTPRSNSDQRYRVDVHEDVQDPILGSVNSLVRVNDDLSRVLVTMTRPHDRAVFTGMRHVAVRADPRLMIYTMNFTLTTTAPPQKASCVRYFVKQ